MSSIERLHPAIVFTVPYHDGGRKRFGTWVRENNLSHRAAGAGDGLNFLFFEGSNAMVEVAICGNGVFGLRNRNDGAGGFLAIGIGVFDFVYSWVWDADIFHNFFNCVKGQREDRIVLCFQVSKLTAVSLYFS